MLSGLAILGVGCSAIFVPLLPEIIEGVQEKLQRFDSYQVNDKAAGLNNACYGIGCIIAPILGGYLNDKVGFVHTCEIMALSAFACGIIYFLIITLPSSICYCIRDHTESSQIRKLALPFGGVTES